MKKTGKDTAVEEMQPVPEPEPLLGGPSTDSVPSIHSTMHRPKTSPYTSPLATLYIGPSRQAYYIRKDLLQRPEWMKYPSDWINSFMRLHSVDEDTGHVLVHYLCTGTYQTLDNTDASTADNGRVEFKRAVLAYFAARTYELDGLRQLAMENIEHCGMEMSTLDIFDLVNQEFPNFRDRAGWFYDYLKEKAKATFEDDCTSFADGGILDRINNVELLKMLAKCVVELYTTMVNNKADCIQTASEDNVSSVDDGPSGEALVEDTLQKYFRSLISKPKRSTIFPLPKPTTGGCVAEELVIACSEKKDESMNEKPLDFTDKKAKKESSGSGFDFSLDAFNDPIQTSDLAVAAAEEKPAEVEKWGFDLASKSKSKSKTKKRTSAVIEEPMIEPKLELMPEPAKPADDCSCTFVGATDKKKRSGAAATLIEETSLPPVELESVPDTVSELVKEYELLGWGALPAAGGAKKKKNKEGAIVETKEESKLQETPPEPPVKPEPEALPLPAPEDDQGLFSASALTVKKKKSKKTAIAETNEEPGVENTPPPPLIDPEPQPSPPPPADTEPEPSLPPAPIDDRGSFAAPATAVKIKKKKGKKVVREEPVIAPDSIPESAKEENKDENLEGNLSFEAPVATKTIKKKGKKSVKEALIAGEFHLPLPPKPELEPAPLFDEKSLSEGWDGGTDDGWGAAAAVIPVKKAKKGKKVSIVVAIPDPPEEDPLVEVAIPEPVVETNLEDSWGNIGSSVTNSTKKNKKGKKRVVEAPLIEVAMCEPVIETGLNDTWGNIGSPLTKTPKKSKKGKKGVVEEPGPPPPLRPNEFADAPAEISVAEDTELVLQTDHLDSLSSPLSDFIYLESQEGPISELCEEFILAQSEDAILEPPITLLPSLDMDSEYTKKTESGLCPYRAKHLLEGDMWKDCKQCRAVLHQIAIQLVDQVDKDRYEIVDRVLLE